MPGGKKNNRGLATDLGAVPESIAKSSTSSHHQSPIPQFHRHLGIKVMALPSSPWPSTFFKLQCPAGAQRCPAQSLALINVTLAASPQPSPDSQTLGVHLPGPPSFRIWVGALRPNTKPAWATTRTLMKIVKPSTSLGEYLRRCPGVRASEATGAFLLPS